MISKDRSLGGLIDSGYEELEPLYGFREWLLELRENDINRMPVRRNLATKYREDGTRVRGPFKMEIRAKFLEIWKKKRGGICCPLANKE